MRINNFFKLVIAVAVSESAGIIGSVFTMSSVAGWYAGIVKPEFNPPAWVFGPVWTALYALMGISLFLIWSFKVPQDNKQHPNILENIRMLRIRRWAIFFFFAQLVLNTLWSIIFFGWTSLTINGLNNIGIALIEIVFLWLAILATIIIFAKISKLAAWLLVPYILWVSFALYLNYAIWLLN